MTKGDIDRPRIMVDIMGKNRRTRLGMVPVTYFILKKLRYNVEKMTIRKNIFYMDKKIIKKIYITFLGKVMIKIIEMIFIIMDIYTNIETVSIMDIMESKILTM